MKRLFRFAFARKTWNKTKEFAGVVFTITTVILAFVPLNSILDSVGMNKNRYKILIIIILSIFSSILALISIMHSENKGVVLYSKENTIIDVKFGDICEYMSNDQNKNHTIVVPINTHIYSVGDKELVRKGSIHGFWIEIMEGCNYDKSSIGNLVIRNINTKVTNMKCKIGDYSFIKNINRVDYLLVATCEVNNSGQSVCDEQQYFHGLQAVVNAIVSKCDIGQEIYIPVIGGGYAFMEKTNQELLRMMAETLIFNCKKLQHKIHIIVYEKLKDDIKLGSLRPE